MRIVTELYETARSKWPASGRQIVAHQAGEQMVVYQAYKPAIARYAVANQQLGGSDFSYNRMSWIKPNFLWMMYRCGWAEKENHERVLALWIAKKDMERVLAQAAHSTFNAAYYPDYEAWKKLLAFKEVRLQWDPDHDPMGNKVERRAIQLGLKGEILELFGKEMITGIEDITDYVKEQKQRIDTGRKESLEVPVENVWEITDTVLSESIGILKPV